MFKRYRKPFSVLLLCIFYGLLSLFSTYKMLDKYKSNQLHETNKIKKAVHDQIESLDIWDVSGVGMYLWQHILEGNAFGKHTFTNWYEDTCNVSNLNMKYKLGYGFYPEQCPYQPSKHMFLILNGRDPKAVDHARVWLDFIINRNKVTNLGLLLLGDEACNNDWLKQYLHIAKLRVVFLIYDSPLIDNKKIFGWPLGVASYRRFPSLNTSHIMQTMPKKRPHLCNFIGTVYANSSRQNLKQFFQDKNNKEAYLCQLMWRNKWTENESEESVAAYVRMLSESDLTLSPAGRDAECYRTYEAIELGSIPVVEDVPSSASCSFSYKNANSPYSILKEYKAPVIFVRDWIEELPGVLRHFNQLPLPKRLEMRLALLNWYVRFKKQMKDRFVSNTYNLFHWNE